ncbi:penicillin-binding transpeptidase domain-containing protein [Corallococcus macrosporus]|uniref:Penicillin-binding protein n=1 Tax=Corallococcus macrosporus DSM 14697 TaxID=1189310 RepID=A0A250K5J6_9BACT|nr:penicillin-binding transpeptidase domain-containing protein [Corallococcus macrosporus]ATB51180.1 penicillin-binding protein [Corallococcus macrosporus DSM 14697]
MSRRAWKVGVLALVAAFLTACASRQTPTVPDKVASPEAAGPVADGPVAEAEAYLHAWAAGDFAAMRRAALNPPAHFEAMHRQFRDGLRIASSQFELGPFQRDGDATVATYRAAHLLRGLGEWEVEGTLRFVRHQGPWRLQWTPAVLHPEARDGDRFSRTRTAPQRADILDARGALLTPQGEVITIGVDPSRVRNMADVAAALQFQTGVSTARFDAAMRAPGAATSRFVPIVDLPPEHYQQVRPALAPVPGIFFRRKSARTSADGFASHTLGRVGEVTAELLPQMGPTYLPGDLVGLSGLERAYEVQLAGSPSGDVLLMRAWGETQVLFHFEGEPGAPLSTTLRREVQAAAEAALEGVTHPAALVAVDSATGAILAVASRPLSQPLHRALTGRYPPGSTFKVVTTEALLAQGMRVDSPVACPPTAMVRSKSFRNFEGESLGDTTLRQVFAHSCNTAFVTLATGLGGDALSAAARRFGFDVPYAPGLTSAGASFPAPADAIELAAAAIGQGRVLATPLHMASVAAAAETGEWRAPFLVEGLDGGPSSPLSDGVRAPLTTLMRAVVTEGSGKAGRSVPGLAGKTGTAEFGTVAPLPTHAWFIGFRKGVGFAVLVEGGGVGGRVAAPIAAKFAGAL